MAKIQTLESLKKEMLAVARKEREAPVDAGETSYESQEVFESAEAIVRLLTPENRHLLSLIESHRPESVAELANLAGRAEPNVSRTLSKMAATGFVKLIEGAGRAKRPALLAHEVIIKINVLEPKDVIAFA
jgi:predicted transcriptional regulator